MVDIPDKLPELLGTESLHRTVEEIRATLPIELRERLDDAIDRIRQAYKSWDDFLRS
jgi:hypothetical protein